MTKISIIIPCYNSFKKMKNCLDSLEKQTYKSFEVIFIDDCSTDDTYEKLCEHLTNVNYKYKLYKNESNIGPGKTRNFGILKSNTEYVTFLDSDDYIENNTLEIIQEIFEKKEYDAIIFDYILESSKYSISKDTIIYQDEGEINPNIAFNYITGSTHCKVYKLNMIIDNNILFSDLKRNEDVSFTKTAILNAKTVFYLKKELYHYCVNTDSLMHDDSLLDENNTIESFKLIENEINKLQKFELIERIFLTEVMYSSIYTMILREKSKKDILEMIQLMSNRYPKWKYWIKKHQLPKLQKLFLKLIFKERIFLLRILVRVREKIRKS